MKQNTKKIFKFYWKHVLKQKGIFFLVMLGIGFSVTVSMYRPILFKDFIDTISLDLPKSEIKATLINILLMILGLSFVEWIGWRVAEFLSNRAWTKAMKNITEECFTYTQGHSVEFFNNTFIGSLIKKINRAPRAFDTFADKFIWAFWPMLIRLSLVLIVLTYLNFWLGITMLVWTIGFMISNWMLAIYKLKYDIERSMAETKSSAVLADTLTNYVNIKLFAGFNFEFKKFSKVLDDWRKIAQKTYDLEGIINAIQAILMMGLEFITLYIAIQMWGKGQLTIGGFVLIQSYVFEVFHQLWDFGKHMRAIYERLADAEEMIQILETSQGVIDIPKAKKIKVLQGTVNFNKVDFAYDNESETVINNLNLNIKSGEKIALIGPSGGGKSTVTKLILRLYNINNGEILIDGQNIAKVTQDSLRRHIALVPQDPILFHRSLEENIAYGRKGATKKEVVAASKLAKCHEFISEFKEGYNTLVGERGIKLSGGQRQRIAIARAILANAQILILDEATSSLDSESESLIQEALNNLMKNKTTIIVAHRLSTIMKADRILVLKKGEIVEEGSHSDLLNKNNSLYKRLWDLQVGGYMGDNSS